MVQRTYYHPYGKPIGNYESTGENAQPYKYGGKEMESMMGLTLFDFQARRLDYSYNSFTTRDPLEEIKPWITSYHYCSSNPMNRIDPTGMQDINGGWLKEVVVTPNYNFVNYNFYSDGFYNNAFLQMLAKANRSGDIEKLGDENKKNLSSQRSEIVPFKPQSTAFSIAQFNPDYDWDGISSWWEWGLDGLLYAGDFLLGGPSGESLVAKAALAGITKGVAMKLTNKQVTKMATKHSMKEVKEFGLKNGQKIFKKGNKYYSYDVDNHNGGVWKVFEKAGGELKRIGTADNNLTIFKN